MLHNIIILAGSPFNIRDYSRFGVDILKRHFRVFVYDCTPWINPHLWKEFKNGNICPEYKAIFSWEQFVHQITHIHPGIAIDHLGGCVYQYQIHKMLRDARHLRAVTHDGLIPASHRSSIQQIQQLKMMYSLPGVFFQLATHLKRKILSCFQKMLPPDIAILSGEDALRDFRVQTKHKIWAHSFDYDLYLRFRNHAGASPKPYAVFLDSDMAYHSDFIHMGIRPPVTAGKYYPALLNFFDYFKHHTGLDLMFAAHPKSHYDLRPHLLNGLQPMMGKTPELVRDAELVLCHDSTAVSFPILWRKPIILLTSNELERSWVRLDISNFSKLLHAPIVNIDCLPRLNPDLKTWMRIDEDAYDAYKKRYIKMPGTPEKPVWEIFADYVKNNLKDLIS